jgi:hypothetical protein
MQLIARENFSAFAAKTADPMQESDCESPESSSEPELKILRVVRVMDHDWEIKEIKLNI